MLDLLCCVDFSLAVVCGLLIAVASLVAEHRLQARGLQYLWYLGYIVEALGLQNIAVVVHRLSVPQHVGSSQTKDQSPALAAGSFTTEPPGRPQNIILLK